MRETLGLLSLVVLVGCSFQGIPNANDERDGGVEDGGVDAAVDAMTDSGGLPACETWAPRRFFDACSHAEWLLPQPSPDLTSTMEWIIDTDAGTLTPLNGAPVAIGTILDLVDTNTNTVSALVLIVTDFTVPNGSIVRTVGARPLVVASYGTVSIAGTLNASSRFVTDAFVAGGGAAASDDCPTLDGNDDTSGGAGAGGGGYGGAGGQGGASNGGAGTGATGGGITMATSVQLLGGCEGGQGGDGDQGAVGGLGGLGGGAILISSLSTIQIAGAMTANGAGGRAQIVTRRNGGGGGGAGGLIALESTQLISISGQLAANGGGGGAGCNGLNNECDLVLTTQNGADGALGTAAAVGGIGNEAGNGGPGGAQENAGVGQPGLAANRGGGGGGGGAGHILVIADAMPTTTGSVISPDFSRIPPAP